MVDFSDPTPIVLAACAVIVAGTTVLSFIDKKYPMAFTFFTKDPYRVLELRLVRDQIDLEKYKKYKKILDDNRKNKDD